MPISDRLNCIFVHIPKTGGTSVEKALDLFGPWQEENRITLFGSIKSNDLQENILSNFLQHLTYPQIKKLITYKQQQYFSFSVVRNPWDRLVSTYSNPDPNLCKVAKEQGLQLKNISFAEFVKNTKNIQHIHLLPQSEFVLDENNQVLVDFIGRFENISKDFQKVCAQLNIHCDLPHANPSQRESRDYRDYYDEITREEVARRYARDIEYFGYQFI